MALLTVHEETCTRCGDCAAVCPGALIYFKEGRFPRMLPGADEFCLHCGHCIAACPSASLVHAEIPPDTCLPLGEGPVTLDLAARLIRERRSIRRYTDKPVEKETLENIIDVARYAPTGHHFQEVRWLVVNGFDAVQRLAATGTEWMHYMVEKDPDGLGLWLQRALKRQERNGTDEFLRGAPAVVIAGAGPDFALGHTDSVIALSYFDLAASAAGLGCCWAGYLLFAARNYPPMAAALGFPDDWEPWGALMVGYPRYSYARVPARKPADITWRE